MENYSEINKYILSKTIDGSIDRDFATKILKAISNEKVEKDIAIIGMECKAAHTNSKEELWDSIINGCSGVREMPRQRIDQVKSVLRIPDTGKSAYIGYLERIDEFDPAFFRISNREAKLMDPKQRMFLEVFYNSLEDAGYAAEDLKGKKVGIFVGADHSSDMQISYKMMMRENDMMGEVGTVSGIVARRPAYLYNLKGPAMVIDTSCSSSLVAIHTACQALDNGDCEMAVIGGINIVFFTNSEGKFSDIESQSVLIRSFDKNANGTNWGEGIAAIVLKPLKAAKRDRDNILAVIKGTGINNDGTSNGIVSPNPEAQEDLIYKILNDTKIDPATISYVECHGTGTVVGDQIEIRSLSNAYSRFTKKKQYCGIGSVKPNIGHLVGASALVGIIKVVMALNIRTLPPSINLEQPNPLIKFTESPFYVVDKKTKWGENGAPLRAAINSFGFSGTNTHAILESAPQKEETSSSDPYEIVTLSSLHRNLMGNVLDRYLHFLKEKKDTLNFADFCYTVNAGRRANRYRAAFLTKDFNDLIQQIEDRLKNIRGNVEIFQEPMEDLQSGMKEANESIQFYKDFGRKDKAALVKIADLYEQGADIKWNLFYEGLNRYRVEIPVTVFKRGSYWIDPDEKLLEDYQNNTLSGEKNNVENGIYKPAWVVSDNVTEQKHKENYILFGDQESFELPIIEKLKNDNHHVCYIGRTVADDVQYLIDPSKENSYEEVLKKVLSSETDEYQILYFWGMKDKDPDNAYKNLVRLIRALSYTKIKTTVKVVTDRVLRITGNDDILSGNSQNMLLGVCKTAEKEISTIRCECVDIEKDKILGDPEAQRMLYDELCMTSKESMVGIRKGLRFIESYKKISVCQSHEKTTYFKKNGTYLITGGTGTLGSIITEHLAREYQANVILLTRHEYGDITKWLHTHSKEEKNYEALEKIIALKRDGLKIEILNVNLINSSELEVAVKTIEEKYGNINGVFHLAGVTDGRLMLAEQLDKSIDVFEGKVKGLDALESVFSTRKIEFMVLFSSLLNFFGAPGQSAYISANMYLDGYANKAARIYPERKIISINWDNFKDVGMATQINKVVGNQIVLEYGFRNGLVSKDCMKVIEMALDYAGSQIYVSLKNMDELKEYLNQNGNVSDIGVVSKKKKIFSDRPELTVAYVEPNDEVQVFFAEIWAELFEINKVGIKDNFYDLGGDSIFVIKFVTAVKDKYPIEISDVFKYLTIEELAKYVYSNKLGLKEKFDRAKENLKNMMGQKELCPEEKARQSAYMAQLSQYESLSVSKKKVFDNILLLGSTGFVGTYLLHNLLLKTNSNIYLIVRENDETCQERQKRILAEYFGKSFYDTYHDRIKIYAGEVCNKRFGLSEETYDMLCNKIDCIVNSVGKVDHYGKYEDFRVVNVVSVENIIEFAKTGNKKEIHHLSTKGVAMGDIPERDEVIFTENDIDFNQKIPNYYTESKNTAEKLLVKAREDGICANIYRTAEIIGDSNTGKFQKNIDKNAVYLEVRALLNFDCTMSASFGIWEISFVDTVSRFMVELMMTKGLENENFHLLNRERVSIDDWNNTFKELGMKKEEVSLEEFIDYLYENENNPLKKKYVNDFLLHTNILEWNDSTQYRILSDKTELILKKMGLVWIKPTKEQLIKLLQYGKSLGFFEY